MRTAISSRSAGDNRTSAAPIHPSTCAADLAPTMAPVTAGHASTQAMAISPIEHPCRSATGREPVAEREVGGEPGRRELRAAVAVVVGRKRGEARRREPVRQEARLHRAVGDHPDAVGGAPGKFGPGDLPADGGEGRLEGLEPAPRRASAEQADVEVADAAPAHLPLLHQPEHRVPRVLHRGPGLVGPVELVQVDPLHAEAPERGLALPPDRGGLQHAPRLGRPVLLVPDQSALGEDEGPLRGGQCRHRLADDHLRMPQPVHGRGIEPVDAQRDGPVYGLDRGGVVLRPPAEGPRPANRPGPEAQARDVEIGPAESAARQSAHQ